MKTIKPILCVIPGYDIINPSPEKVVSIAKKALAPDFDCTTLKTTLITYPRSLGAPLGGERGITLDLVTDHEEKIIQLLINAAIKMGQIDTGYILYENDKFISYWYNHNSFDDNKLVDSEIKKMGKEDVIHMKDILESKDMEKTSLLLQEAMEAKKDAYYDLPIYLEETDEGIEWITVQNPYQGQIDKEIFIRSVNAIFDSYEKQMKMGSNHCFPFFK